MSRSFFRDRALLTSSLALVFLFCSGAEEKEPMEGKPMTEERAVAEREGGGEVESRDQTYMELTSTAFGKEETIPTKHTCHGKDLSPALSWSGSLEDTKSYAVVCDDPDAPSKTWVHWVIFNIPPQVTSLPEGVPPDAVLADGARQGTNDFGRIGYGGPCPPRGKPHRYFFKIYALDAMLDLDAGASKKELLSAMDGHVLSGGQLMGVFGVE